MFEKISSQIFSTGKGGDLRALERKKEKKNALAPLLFTEKTAPQSSKAGEGHSYTKETAQRGKLPDEIGIPEKAAKLSKQPASNQALLQPAVKADQVAEDKLTPSWAITGSAAEYTYAVSDLPGTYRMAQNLVDTIRNTPSSPATAGLGLMSGASVITGYVAVSRGYIQNQEAKKVNDYWGKVNGRVTMARGGFETAGGLVMLPARSLTIAATMTSAKSAQKAATILGITGSGLFGATYILLAIPSAVSAVQGVKFQSGLNKHLKDPEKNEAERLQGALEFLYAKLELSHEEKKSLANQADETVRDETGNVKEVEIHADDAKLLNTDDEDYIRGFVRVRSRVKGYDAVTKIRLDAQIRKAFITVKKRKEAELSRKSGGETVAILKHELQKPQSERLISQLRNSETNEKATLEAKELISKVKGNTRFNILYHGAIVFASILGAAAFTAGIFLTGGVLGLVVAAALLVTSLSMLGIDSYALYDAWKNQSPEAKDKALMVVASIFLTAALIVGGVFSGGIVPLIAIGVISGLWLGTSGYSYYRWSPGKADSTPEAEIKEKLA